MAKRDLDVATQARQAELDMANYNREIAEMIRSGEYFRDALRWYDEKYHAPIIEKAYSIMITLVAVIATCFAVVGFLRFLPIEESATVVSTASNVEERDFSLQRLSVNTRYTNHALLKYFVNEYVIRRENYSAAMLDRDVKRIKAQSSPEVFKSYSQSLNPSNPQSPITRFERHTQRSITIDSAQFAAASQSFDAEKVIPTQATVHFTATVTNAKGAEKSAFKAVVTFSYTPVRVDQETFAITPMGFQVTDYVVSPAGTQ
jgi:type IV secretion system protein VirB8